MMRKLLIIPIILIALSVSANLYVNESLLKEGDIIFHESNGEQSYAIKLSTHSRYTHAGIIFKYNNQYKVLEAVQPVKITDLNSFIKRGVNNHFVIKRLKNSDTVLTTGTVAKMKTIGKSYIGKNYDLYFEWNDDRIYCTELIWKIYHKAAGIELGNLQRLKDFDLSHPYVKNLMKKRYGNNIPYEEFVISPQAMFNAENMITVISK